MSTLNDYFDEAFEIEEELLRQYDEINDRKKKDEKWLKENGKYVKEIMERAGKDKKDVGNYRVSVVVPDTSKFDEDKLLEVLTNILDEDALDKVTTRKINETVLTEMVEAGEVDIDTLKAFAWVESKGSPRLTIKRIER